MVSRMSLPGMALKEAVPVQVPDGSVGLAEERKRDNVYVPGRREKIFDGENFDILPLPDRIKVCLTAA